jgi:hypothetical protein
VDRVRVFRKDMISVLIKMQVFVHPSCGLIYGQRRAVSDRSLENIGTLESRIILLERPQGAIGVCSVMSNEVSLR